MKSTIVLFILALIVATVQAATFNTNGERLARGLPPRAPRRLYRNAPTAVEQAKRSKPSGTPPPSQCTTGPVQCCNTVEKASAPGASTLLGLLGIVLKDVNALVGLGCSPITAVGVGGGTCSAHTVCCENNSHGTLISIGCIPIFL